MFKPGDVVRLKSGGPKMTVIKTEERDATTVVECNYFPLKDNGDYAPQATGAAFYQDTLELVKIN